MKAKEKSQRNGSEPVAAEGVSSDEWFVRYLRDAVLLVVLVLTAIGIGLYLDGGQSGRDWSRDLGTGFLVCLLLCPILVVVTLGLAVYAGVRLFLRPHTLGHAFVRLTLLAAHVSVLLVCADTVSSTAAAVFRSVDPSSSTQDPTEAWKTIAARDFSGSPADQRGGTPDSSSFSPPSSFRAPGLSLPGGGMGSR